MNINKLTSMLKMLNMPLITPQMPSTIPIVKLLKFSPPRDGLDEYTSGTRT